MVIIIFMWLLAVLTVALLISAAASFSDPDRNRWKEAAAGAAMTFIAASLLYYSRQMQGFWC